MDKLKVFMYPQKFVEINLPEEPLYLALRRITSDCNENKSSSKEKKGVKKNYEKK